MSSRRQSVGVAAVVHKRNISGEGVSSPSSSQCAPAPRFGDRPGNRRESAVAFTTEPTLSSSLDHFGDEPLDNSPRGDKHSSNPHQNGGGAKYNKHDEGTGDDDEATRNRLIRINSQLNADDIFHSSSKRYQHDHHDSDETNSHPEESAEDDDHYSDDCEDATATTETDDPDYITEDDDAGTCAASCNTSPGGEKGPSKNRFPDGTSERRSKEDKCKGHLSQITTVTTTTITEGGSNPVFDEVDAKIFIYLQLVQWGPLRHSFSQWKRFRATLSSVDSTFGRPLDEIRKPSPPPSTAERDESENLRPHHHVLRFIPPPVAVFVPGPKVVVPPLDLEKVKHMKDVDEGLVQGPPLVVRGNGTLQHVAPRPATTKTRPTENKGLPPLSSETKRPSTEQARTKKEPRSATAIRQAANVNVLHCVSSPTRGDGLPSSSTPIRGTIRKRSTASTAPSPPSLNPSRTPQEEIRDARPEGTTTSSHKVFVAGGAKLGATPDRKQQETASSAISIEKTPTLERRSGGPARCAPAPALRGHSAMVVQDGPPSEKAASVPKREVAKLPDTGDGLEGRRSGFHVDVHNVGHQSRWGHASKRHFAGSAQGGSSAL